MLYHNNQHRRRNIIYIRRNDMVSNKKQKSKPVTLQEAIDGFLMACHARMLSSHTIDDYTRTLKKFVTHTGDMPFEDIRTTQITAFLAAQKVAAKTLLNYHIGLSSLWTWAIKEGHVERHIVRMVDKPKPLKVVVQPFSAVEVRALLNAVKYEPDRNRAMILLLLDTGARASELCNLKHADIDLTRRQMKVLGKGNKERLLPFSARTGSALFVHLSRSKGKPFELTRTSLAQYLRRLGERAGVPDAHPHKFRHTFAVNYLRNGGDPYSLQQILGHTTMDMVKHYVNLAQVDLESAHKRASPVEKWGL